MLSFRCSFPHVAPFLRLLSVLFVAAGPPDAAANPLPDGIMFTHVQSVNPTMCDDNDITTCEELVRWTTETGTFEFDMFFQNRSGDGPVESFDCTVYWSPEWSFNDLEICVGTGDFEVQGASAQLNITLDPPQPDPFFLVARVVLDAPIYGRTYCSGHFRVQDGYDVYSMSGAYAYAGRECGNCFRPCQGPWDCSPRISPLYQDLSVAAGDTTTASFFGTTDGDNCGPVWSVMDSWMTLEVVQVSPSAYELTVTVDTSNLAPGFYRGWIMGETNTCSQCSAINLWVTPSTSVERGSWGELKGLFR